MSCAPSGFFFIRLSRQSLAHPKNYFSFDCSVSISRTFKNFKLFFGFFFQSMVTLVSRTPLGFFLIRLLRQYLGHFQKSFSFEGYVSISHTSRIHLSLIVALVSRAPSGFIFIQLLRQCPAHLQDSFSFDCYVNILRTFQVLFHSIVALVSWELLGFSFIRLLLQCIAHLQDSFSSYCYVSIPRACRILFH